jgi:hypothetical protein
MYPAARPMKADNALLPLARGSENAEGGRDGPLRCITGVLCRCPRTPAPAAPAMPPAASRRPGVGESLNVRAREALGGHDRLKREPERDAVVAATADAAHLLGDATRLRLLFLLASGREERHRPVRCHALQPAHRQPPPRTAGPREW